MTPTTNQTTIESFQIFYQNEKEMRATSEEIFINEEYKVSLVNTRPLIIDCGSHIGLTVLYFKKLFPKARILCFEPNPLNFKILKKNVEANHLTDIRILNLALGQETGKTKLFCKKQENNLYTCQGTVISDFATKDNLLEIEVSVVKLSSFIVEPVDILKMDIEGAECLVLPEIEPKMNLINQIILEYHGLPKPFQNTNRFRNILKMLKRNFTQVDVYNRKPLTSDNLHKEVDKKETGLLSAIQKWKMDTYQKYGLLLFKIKNPYSFIIKASKENHEPL